MDQNVHIKKLNNNIQMPTYAHNNDAGMDVFAAEEVSISPGETVLVSTGFAIAVPDGYEMQIRPRSGLSIHTMLRIPNSPGTIDSGYRNEVKIIIHNASFLFDEAVSKVKYTLDTRDNPHGTYLIRQGDRIAQMILAKVNRTQWIETDSLDGIGYDRQGGFGSTGR